MKFSTTILLFVMVLMLVIGCDPVPIPKPEKKSELIIGNVTEDTVFVDFGDGAVSTVASHIGEGYTFEESEFTNSDSLKVNFNVSGNYVNKHNVSATIYYGEQTSKGVWADRGLWKVENICNYALVQLKIQNDIDLHISENLLSEPISSGHKFEIFLTSGTYLLFASFSDGSEGYIGNIEIINNEETNTQVHNNFSEPAQ